MFKTIRITSRAVAHNPRKSLSSLGVIWEGPRKKSFEDSAHASPYHAKSHLETLIIYKLSSKNYFTERYFLVILK